MRIKAPTAAPPPLKLRTLELAGAVARKLEKYRRFIGDDVTTEYVVDEGLRVFMKGDAECRRVSPPSPPEKLRNIELGGDVAARLELYQARLGGKEKVPLDYVIEEMLRQLMSRDFDFQARLREEESANAVPAPTVRRPAAATAPEAVLSTAVRPRITE